MAVDPSNWQQALLQTTPQSWDANPNPDFDRAMGYDIKDSDSAGTGFMKGLQSAMSRNTPEGKQLTFDIARQKLSAQLQMQLKQQQYDFAKTHPTFVHYSQTGLGGILAFDEYGNKQVLQPDIPGMAEAKVAEQTAATKKAQMEADPDILAAQKSNALLAPQMTQSKIDDDKARAGLVPSEIARNNAIASLNTNKQNNVGTTPRKYMSQKDAFDDAAMQIVGDKPGGKIYQRALRDTDKGPQLLNQINQKAQELYQQDQSQAPRRGGGIAAPQAAPDMSNLMNFDD